MARMAHGQIDRQRRTKGEKGRVSVNGNWLLVTYLLLGELLAASLLADLVALVVAAGGALAAVILALAADALAAALALLLRLQDRWARRRREGVVGGGVVGVRGGYKG